MTTITHETIVAEASLVDSLKPRVGFDNLFRDGEASASSESVSGPVEQAFDGLTYDAWTSTGSATEWVRVFTASSPGASVRVSDYMAVAAHTLSGCTLTPQWSNDGAAWSNLATAFVAVNNRPIVWEYAEISANYYRLLIENAAAAVSIGAIHVGMKLSMERGLSVGFKPPYLNEDIEFTNAMSVGGQMLGRTVVRRGVKTDVALNNVTWLWARDDWFEFLEVAESYAGFFWWVNDGRAEIVYGGITDVRASFSDNELLSVNFQVDGLNR